VKEFVGKIESYAWLKQRLRFEFPAIITELQSLARQIFVEIRRGFLHDSVRTQFVLIRVRRGTTNENLTRLVSLDLV